MNRAKVTWFVLLTVAMLAGCSHDDPVATTAPVAVTTQATTQKTGKWESAMAEFDKQDLRTAPPAQPILFVGSSTIRFWKVKEAFPDLPVMNRGFGGSEIDDVNFYFERAVARYKPSTIVFYSGDNDLAAGKSVDRVVGDMQQFLNLVHNKLPNTKLIVIGIKPSILRWLLIDKFREANQRIGQLVRAYPGGVFVNVESKILDDDGRPRAELFRIDGLHLNEKGYEILDEAVRPLLQKTKE